MNCILPIFSPKTCHSLCFDTKQTHSNIDWDRKSLKNRAHFVNKYLLNKHDTFQNYFKWLPAEYDCISTAKVSHFTLNVICKIKSLMERCSWQKVIIANRCIYFVLLCSNLWCMKFLTRFIVAKRGFARIFITSFSRRVSYTTIALFLAIVL